jgi:hypothetical protein
MSGIGKDMERALRTALLVALLAAGVSRGAWSMDLGYRLAILPFKARDGRDGVEQSEIFMLTKVLEAKIADTGALQVIDVTGMLSVREEQVFQLSGLTDQEGALEVGRILGVDLILIGTCGRYEEGMTLSLILLDIASGEALAGLSRTIRENSFETDLGYMAARVCGEIETLRGEISRENLDSMIRIGDFTEAWRMALLAERINSAPTQALLAFEALREKRSASLGAELARSLKKRKEIDAGAEIPLLLALAPRNDAYIDLVSRAFVAEELRRRREFAEKGAEIRGLLREGLLDEAREALDDLWAEGPPEELMVPLRAAYEEALRNRSLQDARLAFLRGKFRTASYAAYPQLDPARPDPRLLDILVRSEAGSEDREFRARMEKEKPRPFSPGTRNGLALSVSAGYGAGEDAVAKYITKGTGYTFIADAELYVPLLPPIHWMYGAAVCASSRDGSLSSDTGETLPLWLDLYSVDLMGGAAFRFRDFDLGASVNAGPALLVSRRNDPAGSGEAADEEPGSAYTFAVSAGFSAFFRYYVIREIFVGVSVGGDSFFTVNYPPVESWRISVMAGWSL